VVVVVVILTECGRVFVTVTLTQQALKKDATTGKISLELENGEVHEGFDQVILAVGRRPNVAPLKIDSVGVKTNQRGQILVDGKRSHFWYKSHGAAAYPDVASFHGVCNQSIRTRMWKVFMLLVMYVVKWN